MDLKLMRCNKCRTRFGVDAEVVDGEESLTCPLCAESVDVEEDEAAIK